MLFRGVILEGVAAAGKSSLLRALLAHPAFVARPGGSCVVLTEHHTQRVLEARGPRAGLRVEDHVALLRQHADYLMGLHQRLGAMERWARERLPNPRLVAVLERFHLSHLLNYQHLAWADVVGIDEQLAAIGFHLCLVTASAPELERRFAADRGEGDEGPAGPEQGAPRASRDAPWGSFLAEEGQRHRLAAPPSSAAEAAAYYIRQQDEALALAARSRLPQVRIDTTTTPAEAAAEQVLDVLLGR
jgi:hypothetical protein